MRKVLFRSLLFTAVAGSMCYIYATLPDVSALRKKNPEGSALMDLRDAEYKRNNIRVTRQQIWVPYGAISDHLKRSILISEDAAFFRHTGVDLNELTEALKMDWESGSFRRGGSTITMQLAKNLYLSPSKNPLRKVKEIMIAWQLEQALSKTRIFEIYLNVVEWGRGIYGAEAASRYYFGKSAAGLDLLEAATLAALLPSPRSSREKGLLYRRNLILSRLASVGYLSTEEYGRARQVRLFQKVKEQPPFVSRED